MPISSPSRVDERAAGIAEIDGGIGLDEILEIRDAEPAAAGGADDALRDRLAEAERIADRQHDIARAQLVRAAHRHDRRILDRHAQDRQIGIRIRADDLGRGDAPVGQLHADLIRALDDVVIGDDVTGRIDDHAGAEAALDALAHVQADAAAAADCAPEGRGGGVDHARRVDVDDGRAGARARRRRRSVCGSPALRRRQRRRCVDAAVVVLPTQPAGRISSTHAGARQTDDGPAEQEDGRSVAVWARLTRGRRVKRAIDVCIMRNSLEV